MKTCDTCHGDNEHCNVLNEVPQYHDCVGCDWACCGFCLARENYQSEEKDDKLDPYKFHS